MTPPGSLAVRDGEVRVVGDCELVDCGCTFEPDYTALFEPMDTAVTFGGNGGYKNLP